MSEQTEVAATTPQQPISIVEAAARLKASRVEGNKTTDTSEAARILGQRAAQARQERQAEQARQAQASSGEEGSAEQDEEAQEGDTLPESADGEQPAVAEAQAEGEPEAEQPQTIDLGDGVKVTLDEVRDGFMLKADHTRKTQALAEERKQLEADRTQRIELLDRIIVAGQQLLGQPKDPEALIEEFGMDEGMRQFFKQQKTFQTFGEVFQARQQEQAMHMAKLKQATIGELKAKHGEKAEAEFTRAVQYVSQKTGTKPEMVEAMIANPEAVNLILDGIAYRELKSKEPGIKRTIAEKPKVTRPGVKVSASASNQSNLNNARAALKASGSPADAVAYLRAMRKANGTG